MELNEILKVEAQQSGIQTETDSLGLTRIMINDEFLIHLRDLPDKKCFFMYAKLCTLPPLIDPQRLNICEMLLEANLFGDEVGDAAMALHRQSEKVVLMKRFDSETTTHEMYKNKLQQFVNCLSYWKQKLSVEGNSLPFAQEESDILELMSKRNMDVLLI